jgi:hypothetical protein
MLYGTLADERVVIIGENVGSKPNYVGRMKVGVRFKYESPMRYRNQVYVDVTSLSFHSVNKNTAGIMIKD